MPRQIRSWRSEWKSANVGQMSSVPEIEKQIRALSKVEFEELMRRLADDRTKTANQPHPPTKTVYRNGLPLVTGGPPLTQEVVDEALHGLP